MNGYFMAHCADSYAYRAITSSDDLIEDDEGNSAYVIDAIADPSPTIEDAIHEVQLIEAVNCFVLSLPPHLRCITLRHFWLGESQSDIATSLGASRSAVCHALRRVYRRGLRELSSIV